LIRHTTGRVSLQIGTARLAESPNAGARRLGSTGTQFLCREHDWISYQPARERRGWRSGAVAGRPTGQIDQSRALRQSVRHGGAGGGGRHIRDVMPSPEPSRCDQVMPGGQPVVCACERTALRRASGRAISPTPDVRFYSSWWAIRAVRSPARRGTSPAQLSSAVRPRARPNSTCATEPPRRSCAAGRRGSPNTGPERGVQLS